MAVYRLLYIKATDFVKYSIGENVLLIIIGFGGILVFKSFLNMLDNKDSLDERVGVREK